MEKTKFGNDYYYPSLKKILSFEIKSLIGRLFSSKIIKTKKKYLELGAGNEKKISHLFEYLDFYNISFSNLNSFFNLKRNKIIGHDLRYKLPFKDNSFKGVYLEHVLEHLHPLNAINLISEIRRILKPNGIVRITVPDLDIYVKEFCKKNKSKKFSKFENGCELIWNLTQNFGHLSVWNFEMLKTQLKKKNFYKIKKKSFMKGENKNLLIDRKDRSFETVYVEGKKSKI